MSIGFSTLSTITKLKGRLDEQRSNFIFLQWCFSICSKYCKKNPKKIEKSSMTYNLVRLQWSLILTSCLSKMLEFYNQSLKKLKLFQPQICDSIMQEFLEFEGLKMKLHSDLIESFKRCKTSLDIFFFSYTDIVKHKELSSLARAVFFS